MPPTFAVMCELINANSADLAHGLLGLSVFVLLVNGKMPPFKMAGFVQTLDVSDSLFSFSFVLFQPHICFLQSIVFFSY